MPFSHDCSLVTGLLKQFREGLLVPVEDAGIVGKTILVTELSSQDAGTRRTGKRVGGVAVVKPDALACNPVHIRGLYQPSAVAGHRLGGVVVRHYEQDIRPASLLLCTVAAGDGSYGSGKKT